MVRCFAQRQRVTINFGWLQPRKLSASYYSSVEGAKPSASRISKSS